MCILLSDTLLGAFGFFLAMFGGLLCSSISGFGGEPGFTFGLEVAMILLPLFGNGLASFSSGGNRLGAELLLDCVLAVIFATAESALACCSLGSTAPTGQPQLFLIALGPGSGCGLPADVLHLVPEAEPGRAPLAVAGLAIAFCCWDLETEPELAFIDTAASDADDEGGGGGANLTVVPLLLAWRAAPPRFRVSSVTFLREDVDMLSEDDDLFMSWGSDRLLCDAWYDFGLSDISMSSHVITMLLDKYYVLCITMYYKVFGG